MNKNTSCNYRKEVIDRLIPYFEKDSRYYLLIGDSGFAVIDRFKEKFPHRITNCGIMEQSMVGIAAGMAISGMIPIVYTIVNFLVFRALEQIRNDIVLQNLNVKLIGTGANDYFSHLGPSHTCGEDDIKIMEIIGMKCYDPYAETQDFTDMFNEWITSKEGGYIRV